jgi:hypothetical protein
MILSSLSHHRTETYHSGRLSTGGAPTCVDIPDCPQFHRQSARATRRSLVHARARTLPLSRTDRPHHCGHTFPHRIPRSIPHRARGTPVPHAPRFRALALFRRRPPERVSRELACYFFLQSNFFVRLESPFLRPDPQYRKAGARRSCQGWPSPQPCGVLRPCQATP